LLCPSFFFHNDSRERLADFTVPGNLSVLLQESPMDVQKLNGESLSDTFITHIRKRARAKAICLAQSGLRRCDEPEDLSQDLLLDLWRRLQYFDESRGNVFVFACRVIQNRVSVLAKKKAHRFERTTVSLDPLIRYDDPNAGSKARFLEPAVDDWAAVNRKIDVRRAIDRLPRPLKSLAHDLVHMTVPEICARSGKSRSRVYEMIREIKDAFIGRGLNSEIRKRSAHRADRKEVDF